MTLQWKKYPVLNDGFICLVDSMGDDSSIVQAAKVSYGKDEREQLRCHRCNSDDIVYRTQEGEETWFDCNKCGYISDSLDLTPKDRQLIRYLLAHGHTTPFEMVEIKFLVRVPMDCWRQWIRHRTASVNEYSTRYTEAIDSQQTTSPEEWRLQATDNKQGSGGFITEWPPYETDAYINPFQKEVMDNGSPPGEYLSAIEQDHHEITQRLYNERLKFGIAKEQARKDLPLSTYTRLYWKCDLRNIFNFLRLRMDSHAQWEIRQYANAMYELIKPIVPVACEAFEDYSLHAKKFSRMEMELLRNIVQRYEDLYDHTETALSNLKPESMSDREWKEFLEKLA